MKAKIRQIIREEILKVITESQVNEISAGQGLNDVAKGRTSAIEGIKMSKAMAEAILYWIRTSPFGRKYGKQIMKGRIHSLLKPANAFGVERGMDAKTKKEWKAIMSKLKESKLANVKVESKQPLNEKFASKKITDMYSKITGGQYSADKKFWGGASRAYGIEWDKVTDDMVSGPTGRMTRKGLEFLLAAEDMSVRGTGRYDYPRTIKKGQILSVAYHGKAMYFGKSGLTTGAASARSYPDYVGLNVMGFKNADSIIKRLPGKVEVYQIDIDKARGAKDKAKARFDARKGATALMDFRTIKRQNQARYEKALTDRLANSSPADQAWKMVEATQRMLNAALKKDLDMLKKGKQRDGWRSASSILQNAYGNMTNAIINIKSAENNAIKGAEKDKAKGLKKGDKNAWSEEKYYLDRIVEEARRIQQSYKEMKAALKKLDKNTEYFDISR
tara:strand:- start:447 stop:1784 length:1338 start_codon:yes stop_codon:yes gene_type:complete